MLLVIPFDASNAPVAEGLIDFIYFLSGKKKRGHCLLIAASSVHEEFRLKIKLSAEVAFENVELEIGEINLPSIAKLVGESYKSNWLLLDAYCVPLKKDWFETLENLYQSQPKKHLGAYIKTIGNDKVEQIMLARNSVYPPNAIQDIEAKLDLRKASTKCRLIQQGVYEKREDVRPDSLIYCSDKSGELMRTLRKELKAK